MKKLSLLLSLCFIASLYSCGDDDDYVAVDNDPTAPQNLIVSVIDDSTVSLTWTAATDEDGIAGYNVYQDNEIIISSTNQITATVDELEADTMYSFFVTALDNNDNESVNSNTVEIITNLEPLKFETTLSQMGVYQGDFSDLMPQTGVQLYEINSTLFTDYAAKQRLIKLPEGRAMEYSGNELLPDFPDNTLIAKTFYYNIDDRDPSLGKQIIETRIFLKINGSWESGDYIWNEAQTEATYRETSSVEDISYIDLDGNTQNINYVIPSKQDCATCHNNNGNTFPIGMKLRSMNFNPMNGTVNQNQLQEFIDNGMLTELSNPSDISLLPDWKDDENYDIFQRARAYIDVNCAHCHQPGGEVTNFDLDFRYETLFDDTGIFANRGEIEARTQSTTPTYRMPQLGRSIVHEEAVEMLLEYLEAIEDLP